MTTTNDWNTNNDKVFKEFRSEGGEVTTRSGNALLLLNTVGVKTGLPRTNPLAYLPGEDCVYVFASKGGSPAHPDWYLNLVANPAVTVEVGTERYEATADSFTGPERRRIYAKQVQLHPNFGDYERKTTRVIPVVALRRAPTAQG
jgi:deazaflavin-dependent oxidoreductase (nitroreductase family)